MSTDDDAAAGHDSYEYATLDILGGAKVHPLDVSTPQDLARVWVMMHGHTRIRQLGVDDPGGENDALGLLNHVGTDGWQLCAETRHQGQPYPQPAAVLQQLRNDHPEITDLAPDWVRLWLKRRYR